MKKSAIAFATTIVLISTNAFASIELSDSCANGIKTNINSIKNQAAAIIVSSDNGGKVQYAAYLLNISLKYVLNMETMQDSELSDVASVCETKFDVKKLVDINRF